MCVEETESNRSWKSDVSKPWSLHHAEGENDENQKNVLPLITIIGLSISSMITSTAVADPADSGRIPVEVTSAINEYTSTIQQSYLHVSRTLKRNVTSTESRLASNLASDATSGNSDLSVTKADVTASTISAAKSGEGYSVTVDLATKLSQTPSSDTKVYIGDTQQKTLDSSWTERHVIALKPEAQPGSDTYSVVSDTKQDEYTSAKPLADDPLPVLPAPSSTSEPIPDTSLVNKDLGRLKSRATTRAAASKVDYLKEIAYADKWTAAPYNTDAKSGFNPAFPYYDDNCTNFESQAMYAGGLPLVGAPSPFLYDTSVWTWNLSGIASASRTWSYAPSNYTFMKDHSNTFTVMDNIWKAWEGSLLYADWTGDGTIDHAMIVVGVVVSGNGKVNPIIDQKTSNRHQITLQQSIDNASKAGHNKVKWYGLQFKF